MYRIFSYPKTYHKCNTVYLRLMRRQCEAIKNIVKCLKSMRRQCEAIKNTVKCLLDPINILNSSSSIFSRLFPRQQRERDLKQLFLRLQ